MSPTRSAAEKESLAEFRIDALNEINPTRKELDGLKDEIREGLHDNMYNVLQYCETNRVDYFTSWKTVLDSGDEVAKEHFRKAMAMIAPSLVSKLEAGDDDAKAMLDVIVHFLKERKVKSAKIEEDIDVLSTDVSGTFLGKVVENLGDRLEENWGATVLSGVVLLWGAGKLWNMTFGADAEGKGGKPYFKNLLIGGGSLLAINHMLGPVIKGQTLFGSIESMFSKGKQQELRESLNDLMPKASEKDKETTEVLLGYASVPFKYLLNAYEKAKRSSSREINMGALQRSMGRHGKNISEAAFKQSLGRGLYNKLEALIGSDDDDIRVARERYVTGAGGAWTTVRVLLDIYDKDPDFAYEVDEVTREVVSGAAGGSGAVATGPEKHDEKISSGLTGELAEAKGFDALDIKILDASDKDSKGTMTVRGFKVPYERKVDATGDKITYILKGAGVGKKDLKVVVGKDASITEAAQQTAATQLEAYAKDKMLAELTRAGVKPLTSPSKLNWDASKKQWEIKNYAPVNPMGHPIGTPTVPLSLTPGGSVRFGDKSQSREAFENDLVEAQVLSDLQHNVANGAFYGATLGLSLSVTKIPDRTKANDKGEGKVEGATFKFHWDTASGTGEYVIDSFTVTSSFSKKKRDVVEKSEDFKTTFAALKAAGPELPRATIGERVNRFWEGLVDFKQAQFLNDYEERLAKATTLEEIQIAYKEEVEDPLHDLRDWPTQLAGMDEDKAYQKLQHLGHSNEAYNELLDDFLAGVRRYDVQGLDRLHAEFKQKFTFDVLDIWYERTRRFRDLDPGATRTATMARKERFSETEQNYLDWLQSQFDLILGKAEGGKRLDLRITKADFEAALPKLRALYTYDEWLEREGRDPALELLVSSVVGLKAKYTWKKVPGTNSIEITFDEKDATGNPIKWVGDHDPSAKTIDVTTMAMTRGMIDAQVDYATTHPDFDKPFYDLYHIFDGMDQRKLTAFKGLEFDQAINGEVLQGKWQALIDYKEAEAKGDYQRDLERIMLDPLLTPKDKADAWRLLDTDFGNKYLRDFTMYAEALKVEIHGMTDKTPREKFTRARFDSIYNAAQSMGYDNLHYRQSMRSLRREVEKFDYRGPESLDAQIPFDVQNKVMALYHKYASFISDLPGTKMTPEHKAYLRYVHLEVMRQVFYATEHGKGTTGTFYDQVIGKDEIPDLTILDFKAFKARPQFLSNPNYTVDVDGLVEKCKEKKETPSGDPATPEEIEGVRDDAEQLTQAVYIKQFEKPLTEAIRTSHIKKPENRARLTEIEAVAETARLQAVVDIMRIDSDVETERQAEKQEILEELGETFDDLIDDAAVTWKLGPVKLELWPW